MKIVVNSIQEWYFRITYPSLYSLNTLSFTTVNNEEMTKVTDHMANERTYLAWVRTGITIMALGFVVAKFGIIIRELVPNAPATSYHLSSAIGIALVIAGGFMQVLALRSFLRNRTSIENGTFQPSTAGEISAGIITLLIAVLLIAYLVITL